MILLPFTKQPPAETLAAVAGLEHEQVFVGHSDTAYFELMSKWWKSDEPYIMTIEHDLKVPRKLIDEMLACQKVWCAAHYSFESGAIYGLGCTKFELPIRRAVPDVFDLIAARVTPITRRSTGAPWMPWMRGVLEQSWQHHAHSSHELKHLSRVRGHLACLRPGGGEDARDRDFARANEVLSREEREMIGR